MRLVVRAKIGLRCLALLAAFLATYSQAHALYAGQDTMPPGAVETFSTNWMAAAKAALPQKYWARDLTFQETTNLLCQESQLGNYAAQGLWGFVLLVQGRSPEESKTGLDLLRNSAEKGYVPGMLQLGLLSEDDKYVRRDYSQAFHWFSVAAERGSAEGQLQLGGCYHYGLGTTKDLAMTAKCYRRSAEQTNYVAMKSLGYLLMNGIGMDKDVDAAKYWLMRAAKEGGNRRAMYNLGVIYSLPFPDTNSMREAFQWFKQSAELGDALASSQLANFYYWGWGGMQTNLDSYHDWRFKAATLGATEAQYAMGAAYRTGDGVPKDIESSLFWYRKAAAKNHPKAFYDLALHHLQAKTNRASMEAANESMLRAAQAGHREAQFQMAMSCFRGDVAAANCESGKQWLARSAENGWARSEFCLFQLYYYGVPASAECPPYPKDATEAIKWLRRAADHENLQAQSTLAVMLIRARNIEIDKERAEKLLRNAAQHGYGPL